MTSYQIALLAGAVIMAGPVLLLWRYAPQRPSLSAYLAPESASAVDNEAVLPGDGASLQDRLGLWMQQHLRWIQVPRVELELLQVPTHRFLAEKATFALVGLLFVPVLSGVLWAMGIPMPWAIPVVGSVMLAAGLSFLPDYNVRDRANAAREEFVFVLGSYLDLIALERKAATSPRQSMEEAARVGDSWVFKRIAEELAHSRLSGEPEWDRLQGLGDRYGINELSELGHIMKIASRENAAVYETLSQRSMAMREARLAKELGEANKVSTKRSAPVALLGLIFTLLLVTPSFLAMLDLI